jgi:hypothetical protein
MRDIGRFSQIICDDQLESAQAGTLMVVSSRTFLHRR